MYTGLEGGTISLLWGLCMHHEATWSLRASSVAGWRLRDSLTCMGVGLTTVPKSRKYMKGPPVQSEPYYIGNHIMATSDNLYIVALGIHGLLSSSLPLKRDGKFSVQRSFNPTLGESTTRSRPLSSSRTARALTTSQRGSHYPLRQLKLPFAMGPAALLS